MIKFVKIKEIKLLKISKIKNKNEILINLILNNYSVK